MAGRLRLRGADAETIGLLGVMRSMASRDRKRQITVMTTSERLEMAERKAKELSSLILEWERVHANNRHLTYGTVFAGNLAHTFAGNAFALLRLSSFAYELTRLAALWDRPSEDRVSIPEVSALINDVDVKAALKQKCLSNYSDPDIGFLRSDAEKRFEYNYSMSIRLTDAVLRSRRLKTLRDHRDKWYAHNLEPEVLRPKFGYERKMRLTSQRVANALTGVISDSGFDYADTVRICRKHADEFWQGLSWSPPK